MANIYMRYIDGKAKAFTISYDDGTIWDKKMLDLMKEYGIKGTFNLNSGRMTPEFKTDSEIFIPIKEDEAYDFYPKEYCSIASHSKDHPTLTKLSVTQITEQLHDDRVSLEKIFKCFIKGHVIPNGPYDDTVIGIGKLCGFKYIRCTDSTLSLDFPKTFFPWQPTCAASNVEKCGSISEKFITETPTSEPFLFYVWGHAHFLEERGKWQYVVDLFKKVSFKDDVWYATNDEIVDYTERFNSLEWSADFKTVYNPSVTPVWFFANGATHSVNPGETYTY